jgi:mevalonate kinase
VTSGAASAPAKVILTGEHAVVYNEPALVMAINRRAHVTVTPTRGDSIEIRSNDLKQSERFTLKEDFAEHPGESNISRLRPYLAVVRQVSRKAKYTGGFKITVQSEIPVSAGLGSSAAIGVAMCAALGNSLGVKLSRDQISKIALESEKLFHGHPSGIDNLISAQGGLIVFRRNEGFLPVQSLAKLRLVIGMTDVERSTAEQVAKVAATVKEHRDVGQLLLHCIGHLTIETVGALREGNVEAMGRLLSLNHWLVNALGVSHPTLDRLVYASLKAGALGAKLTGAGGGGCMIALVTNETENAVAQSIKDEGCAPLSAKLSKAGVQSEH